MIKKNFKLIKKVVLEILFFAVLLIIDLVSKTLVFDFLKGQPNYRFVVWEDIFSFQMAKNYGASFGVFTGEQTFLIVLTSLVILAILIFMVVKPYTSKLLRLGLIMIVSGGIGNLVDRIAFGYVRDFIDYVFLDTFFDIDFAIGNVADIFLLIGTLIIIVYVIFELQSELSEKERNKKVLDDETLSNDEVESSNE